MVFYVSSLSSRLGEGGLHRFELLLDGWFTLDLIAAYYVGSILIPAETFLIAGGYCFYLRGLSREVRMQQTHPEHGLVQLGPVREFLFFYFVLFL